MNDEPRRRGRPPLKPEDQPATVHVTLPPDIYDRTFQLAERRGCSIPAVLRRGLRRELEENADADDV
jgi:hypothetical protein